MTFNWRDVIPADIAIQQDGWECNQRVLRGRESGMTLRALAEVHGLSINRIRQMEAKAIRKRARSPAQVFLGRPVSFTPTEREVLSPILAAMSRFCPLTRETE